MNGCNTEGTLEYLQSNEFQLENRRWV